MEFLQESLVHDNFFTPVTSDFEMIGLVPATLKLILQTVEISLDSKGIFDSLSFFEVLNSKISGF
jgi:hypothetical protein